MSSNSNAIRVQNLSKCYQIFDTPRDRLKQFLLPRFQRAIGQQPKQYFKEFWSLKDVSFEVRKGETVGIIGRNGAGKSTLLQIICGTLNPSGGTVAVNGRVAALLELGSGFNPEFTGRENVYMSASILGLTPSEIDAKYDEIVAFADIGHFINMPLKTYSSGMFVRLAFAVQACIEPQILIIDEALAVGDVRFQTKCFNRIREIRERGTSILLVTHSTEQITTHCDRAILLEIGRKADEGSPRSVVNHYLDLLYGRPAGQSNLPLSDDLNTKKELGTVCQSLEEQLLKSDPGFANRIESFYKTRPAYNPYEYRWGDKQGELMDFFLFADGKPFPSEIASGSHIALYVRYRCFEEIVRPIVGFTLKTKEGITIYGANTEIGGVSGSKPKGTAGQNYIVRFQTKLSCGGGDYFISVGLASYDMKGEVLPHDRRYDSIHLHVTQDKSFFGIVDFQGEMKVYDVT